MAYDYNSQDNRFDLPNPYRVENLFYFLAAAIMITSSLLMLVMARNQLDGKSAWAASPLIIGFLMLVYGLKMAGKAMTRLRFFFGRGQPSSLATNLTQDQVGGTKDAEALKELVRQSSLAYFEPKGPLNGLLYSLFPNLIFSPQYIQAVAQRQFQNALAFIVTLSSLLISLIGASAVSLGWGWVRFTLQ